jgi:hypothetical protein
MENTENLVTEQVTENVEQPTEQTPKMYSQDEVNDIVGKRVARNEAKIRKENDRKYGSLMEVLKAGTGKESVEEIESTFRDFYSKKGIKVQKKPELSEHDIDVLSGAEADEIIRSGYDEVVDEVDRLAAIGFDKMTEREKKVFKKLAEHRQSAERGMELSKIGVTEDVFNSAEFKEFASKFNPNTPVKDVYDIYRKTQPQKEIRTMGSMKSNAPADNGVKDFYSYEEAKKFTKADFDKNPELFKKVQESMTKWK